MITRRFLHVGLGPLGLRLEADLLERRLGAVVAAVDASPLLSGRPLAELVPGASPALRVQPALEAVEDWSGIDCALVTTSSDLRACMDTFRPLLRRGLAVISSCEELSFPWLRRPGLAAELEGLARAHGARILGTGINPGFLMDALPVFASAASRSIRRVDVWRVQDASTRRLPFQRKIGAGLAVEEFRARAAAGTVGHVGLPESLHLVARALGFELEAWEESIEPLLSERDLECALGAIPCGRVAGVRQVARGLARGAERLRLEFQAAIGQRDPHDRVRLDGEPPIDLVLRGGVHGDVGTAAILLNSVAPLLASPPGLHTMATIPPAACADAGARG